MEVLISFLILSSSVMAYTMLVARAELIQTQSNESIKAVFMADYVLNQLALSAEPIKLNWVFLMLAVRYLRVTDGQR